MSYRGFKHVLGETNLERKCRFLFGACLLLLITGSFWWYGTSIEKLVKQQNQTRGDLLVNTILLQKHWENLETNREFKETVVRKLSARLQSQDYEGSFIRPNAVDAEGQPVDSTGARLDDWEKDLLKRFANAPHPVPTASSSKPAVDADKRDPQADQPGITIAQPNEDDTIHDEREINDGRDYLYYKPIYALGSGQCIECHRTLSGIENLAEGDLMAIAKVRIDTGPTQRKLSQNRAILFTAAIITVFLAMIVSYVIVRYVIVKPLKHLRDVSDAISHGDVEQRAEIRTGDEFEELGIAFNRMLRHFVTIQDELRHVNSNLDGKVDELAQANMQLFEMNRLKSDFLATMSHELRTPLNSIIGFSDVLGSIDSLDDKQRRYVKNIQASGRVLLDMINDILDLAKIESGKMEVRPTDFRIEHVISAQCDMARPLTERKNIDLSTEIEPDLPLLHQDQGKVQQILNNLLSNAIKFTPEGGRIRVVAKRGHDDRLELTVVDTGVGIAEEDQGRIFEKFRQGGAVLSGGDAMTREYSGTGLGLSIVKELCKLLGGEISLESQLGIGSTFRVHLAWEYTPLAKMPEPPIAPELDNLTKPRPVDYEHILSRTPATPAAD